MADSKINKPDDSSFKQQRLPAWQPVLTPFRIIMVFLIIGLIFVPVGVYLRNASMDLKEMRVTYDGPDKSDQKSNCKVKDGSSSCKIEFTFEEEWKGPVYVYYELENYYQNHRRYVQSRDHKQLAGAPKDEWNTDKCEPMVKNKDGELNPCGLIAASFFNDKIELNEAQSDNEGGGLKMDETGIAWESDFEKFKQPDGFKMKKQPGEDNCGDDDEEVCDGDEWSGCHESGDDVYCYFYPDDDKTVYLHEKFDDISPLVGVEDEHFMVWMRTAALPTFRKLYGVIDKDFKKRAGDSRSLVFDVTPNFEVRSYGAKKSIVVSTVGEFGGKNESLGIAYISVGAISLVLSLLFFIKHLVSPRKTGDRERLKWQ